MRPIIIVLLCFLFIGCGQVKETPVYDENGALIDKELERTYSWPDMHTFTGWNFNQGRAESGLAIELWDEKDWRNTGSLFVTPQTVGLTYNYRLTSIYEISAGLGAGYTFDAKHDKDEGFSVFVNVLVIDF